MAAGLRWRVTWVLARRKVRARVKATRLLASRSFARSCPGLLLTLCACGSSSMPPCELAELPPASLIEGEELQVQLACNSSVPVHERMVQLEGLPEGAAYDNEAGVLFWTPGFAQAAVYELGVMLPETNERASLRIAVADALLHPSNEPVLDPSAYSEELGLPVLFLDPSPAVSEYTPATITFGGRSYQGEAKLRGSSSLNYPKKNYTLQFDGGDRFDAPEHGFRRRKKMVLTSTFDDNSFVRSRLALDLWNEQDPEHIQIRSSHVVVYADGKYHGLYTLSDHVDRHLMEQHGMLDSGNLYKQSTYAADFRVQEPLHAGVEKPDGKPEDDFTDFGELVTFIDGASDEDFRAQLAQHLDVRDYLDWWVLVTTIRAEDTASKNTYHYLEKPGAPARFAPWDFNASFGQGWTSHRLGASSIRTYTEWNRLFERFLQDPELSARLRERQQAALDGVFHPDHVAELIAGYLQQSGAAIARDWSVWQEPYRSFFRWRDRTDFTSVEEEVAYIESWYRTRWEVLKRGETPPPAELPAPAEPAAVNEPSTSTSADGE